MIQKKYNKSMKYFFGIVMVVFMFGGMASSVFAQAITPGTQTQQNTGAVSSNPPNSNANSFPNPFAGDDKTKSVVGFVTFILEKIVLPVALVVVIFAVIYSGYLFVTAQGNEEKLTEAKKTFFTVIIGSLIILGSVVIATAIHGTLCKISPTIPGVCQGGTPIK